MPLDNEQRKAREYIESIWRDKKGYDESIELTAPKEEWEFYEELLLTNWDEVKTLIGRN
jgi:hypothetical protein